MKIPSEWRLESGSESSSAPPPRFPLQGKKSGRGWRGGRHRLNSCWRQTGPTPSGSLQGGRRLSKPTGPPCSARELPEGGLQWEPSLLPPHRLSWGTKSLQNGPQMRSGPKASDLRPTSLRTLPAEIWISMLLRSIVLTVPGTPPPNPTYRENNRRALNFKLAAAVEFTSIPQFLVRHEHSSPAR